MPPRRATTLRAPCALDGAASRLHVPSAFATVGALERCPSGRRGTPGERVYPQGTEGSNPSLSACRTHLGARPVLAALRAAADQPTRGFRRAPQTPSAGVAPLGARLALPCASRPRRLLYDLPPGPRPVAARSCATRRRELRQVRKEAAG